MSNTFRYLRRRWAAREMVLTRWIAGERTRVAYGEPICEFTIDEGTHILKNMDDEKLTWGLYWHYASEGHEVSPDARLFEFSYDGFLPAEVTGDFKPRLPPLKRRSKYPSVFLSYRREDSEAYAGRLHEALSAKLQDVQVFMDQFSIIAGEPFPWAIQQAAAHCEVMVVLIGPNWLNVTAPGSNRTRLSNETDYVRREITAALDRRIGVIPVLLGGAPVPDESALPDEMRGLEQLQMLQLTSRHWQSDLADLVAAVRGYLEPRGKAGPNMPTQSKTENDDSGG